MIVELWTLSHLNIRRRNIILQQAGDRTLKTGSLTFPFKFQRNKKLYTNHLQKLLKNLTIKSHTLTQSLWCRSPLKRQHPINCNCYPHTPHKTTNLIVHSTYWAIHKNHHQNHKPEIRFNKAENNTQTTTNLLDFFYLIPQWIHK